MTDAPSDDRITELVESALAAHAEGGDAALAAFCSGLGAAAAAVQQRLTRLRAMGLLGDGPPLGTAPAPAVPERLGDFELIEPIGSGGMGVVYRARQLSLEREVAVKLIRPEQLLFPGVRERFQREVAIIAKLQHEGIVRLYSFGEERGIPWFAMERIHGVSLADVIVRHQGRAPHTLRGTDFAEALGAPDDSPPAPLFAGSWCDTAMAVVERVALALEDAHRQGVLHRDIKPSNVMLTASGRVVLLDFGLAWSRDADRLTRSGSELGTIHYMAPEQLQGTGADLDERTDVYGLGVVLRELLTLRPAFPGKTIDQVGQRVRQGLPSPFVLSSVSGARDLETLCMVAMDREPARRYASARLFARDLRHWLERRPLAGVRPTWWLRVLRLAQRHRAASVLVAVLLLAMLLAPLAVAWRERGLRRDLETQIQRADRNLTLAAKALGDTLQEIDTAGISQVPDLKGFVDRTLQNSRVFLDALLASNPADPETRLQLADVLSKVAFVRWQFFEMPATDALFTRVLELLDGAGGDIDVVDRLDLETRLALVYVRGLMPRGAEAAAAFQAALRAVEPHGAFATRPRQVRMLIARCLERLASLRLDAPDVRRQRLLQARDLLVQNAEEQPDVGAWLEVERIEQTLAGASREVGAKEAVPVHQRAQADALAAARAAAAGASVEDRTRLAEVLAMRGRGAQAQRDHAGAIELLDAAQSLTEGLLHDRPSRLDGLVRWTSVRRTQFASLPALGRQAEVAPALQALSERLEAALGFWPDHSEVLRDYLSIQRQRVTQALDEQALPEARAILDRMQPFVRVAAAHERAVTIEEGSYAFALRGRLLLLEGDAAAALAQCEEAQQLVVRALQKAKSDRVGLSPLPYRVFVAAEALLRLGRPVEARDWFSRCPKIPADLFELVPSLEPYRDHPALASTLARMEKR